METDGGVAWICCIKGVGAEPVGHVNNITNSFGYISLLAQRVLRDKPGGFECTIFVYRKLRPESSGHIIRCYPYAGSGLWIQAAAIPGGFIIFPIRNIRIGGDPYGRLIHACLNSAAQLISLSIQRACPEARL